MTDMKIVEGVKVHMHTLFHGSGFEAAYLRGQGAVQWRHNTRVSHLAQY